MLREIGKLVASPEIKKLSQELAAPFAFCTMPHSDRCWSLQLCHHSGSLEMRRDNVLQILKISSLLMRQDLEASPEAASDSST